MLSIWNKEWRADKEKTGIIEQAQASWQDTIALYRYAEGAFKESCQKFSLLHVGVVHTLTFLLLQDFSVII